jgi:hypothetical protein
MDSVLDELRTGRRQPVVTFTDEDLEPIEEERIGEHFSSYPFLY